MFFRDISLQFSFLVFIFCDGLVSLSTTFSRYIRVIACVGISSF